MKLILISSLVFIELLSFNYCDYLSPEIISSGDEERIQNECDPDNLLSSDQINTLIFIRGPHTRHFVAKSFLESLRIEKEKEMLEKEKEILEKEKIFPNFERASRISQNILQWYYNTPTENTDAFQGIKEVPLHQDGTCSHVTMPESDLVKTKELEAEDPDITNVNQVTSDYRRWYCFLSRNESNLAIRINTRLHLYCNQNPTLCDNNTTTLRLKFCASVARSARAFEFIHLKFLPLFYFSEDKYDKSDSDEMKEDFTMYLFSNWQSYSFNNEDVAFLNILLKCQIPEMDVSFSVFLDYIHAVNYNHGNKWVAIPLFDKCLKQEFGRVHFDDV
ncbi:uncharacterized protein LOC135848281 [Planococcus citri]|uniref:uncharacterized protein LOC135848281 n=1 Tax=Planococcus citri TaxID=170843 RepID=UPI0031F962E2